MSDLFAPLSLPDYEFLVGLLESNVNLADDSALRRKLAAYEAEPTDAARAELDRHLERHIRYLGSADFAFLARQLAGKEPGVPMSEVIRDVARALKIDPPRTGTEREMAEEVVRSYATREFAQMPPEQQQRMLEELGVEKDKAAKFVLKSAGVFSLPLLIQAFDAVVVQGLIKNVIFGAIARVIGQQLSRRLFGLLARRLPWWVSWVGPAAWTLSIGWTALDLQGPAQRKIIPAVLFLGVCSLRER